MDLQSTLEGYALQLKNVPRTLVAVARVVQKMMKVLYDTHCPDAENCRPGPNPECPDSDILTIGWLLEYIAADSENAGYRRLKAELKTVFRSLPERSRFNRRRRNLSVASEVLRRALAAFLPPTEVFIVDSFPIPICDFKRAKSSKSDLSLDLYQRPSTLTDPSPNDEVLQILFTYHIHHLSYTPVTILAKKTIN